ncbi:hypothetical protein Tco_0561094 [Tanacetum coccineum]
MEKITMELSHKVARSSDYKTEKLARIYINKIVARHGVPVSIILDRDGQFASHLWAVGILNFPMVLSFLIITVTMRALSARHPRLDVQVALDEIEIDRKTVICSKNLLRSVERIVKKLKRNESQWSNERLELLRQRT